MNNNNNDLIKVEAVNIYSTLSYSTNLNVYRGISLKMRQAVLDVYNELKTQLQLDVISKGASVGVYSCQEQESATVKIKQYLDEHYSGLTFIVVGASSNEFSNYRDGLELLNQKGRVAQLQQTTISGNFAVKTQNVCSLSHVLPADTTLSYQDKKDQPVNSVMKTMFEFGKEQKQAFYKQELSLVTDACPVNSFGKSLEDLATNTAYTNLEGKLAYIYFDGNKFSKIQQQQVTTVAEQQAFDTAIQTLRAKLLNELLTWVANDKDFVQQSNGTARFETLLWGGDEALFVVPASKGFEFVAKVMELTKDWKFGDVPLTNSFGLVFCYMKNPIQRMRAVAEQLAEKVKDNLVNKDKLAQQEHAILGLGNGFNFIVLESIDTPEQTLEQHFKTSYNLLAKTRVANNANQINPQALKKLADLLTKLGKSQSYQMAKLGQAIGQDDYASTLIELANSFKNKTNEDEQTSAELFINQRNRLNLVSELTKEELESIEQLAGNCLLGNAITEQSTVAEHAMMWLLITEIWEYLVLSKREEK